MAQVALLLMAVAFFTGIAQVECSFIFLKENEPSTNADDVHFLLWTRFNAKDAQELRADDMRSLTSSDYDGRRRPTLIYAHGWRQNGTDADTIRIKDELLRNGDWNFISIDWGKLARGHNYPAAKRNVDLVGNATAKLVDFLIVSVEQLADEEEQKACQGRKAGYFHLVGFSLGAHVVGSVGASVNTGPLPRITGLDPAKFGFIKLVNAAHRLDPSDASFVDVIHTHWGGGMNSVSGTANFYVNGGRRQPGCDADEIQDDDTLSQISSTVISNASRCSHRRAVEYFIESIAHWGAEGGGGGGGGGGGFVAVRCDSWDEFTSGTCAVNSALFSAEQLNEPPAETVRMGLPVTTRAAGDYYLRTASQSPFALGDEGAAALLITAAIIS